MIPMKVLSLALHYRNFVSAITNENFYGKLCQWQLIESFVCKRLKLPNSNLFFENLTWSRLSPSACKLIFHPTLFCLQKKSKSLEMESFISTLTYLLVSIFNPARKWCRCSHFMSFFSSCIFMRWHLEVLIIMEFLP